MVLEIIYWIVILALSLGLTALVMASFMGEDAFLTETQLDKKYGPGKCEWCGEHLLKFPYCRCHLVYGEK